MNKFKLIKLYNQSGKNSFINNVTGRCNQYMDEKLYTTNSHHFLCKKDNVSYCKWNYENNVNKCRFVSQTNKYHKIGNYFIASRGFHQSCNFLSSISPQLKKRPFRKKRSEELEQNALNGYFNVIAFATAEEYDLENLQLNLIKQDLYKPLNFFSTDSSGSDQDILYVTAKYKVENEPRDLFFFREGSVVLWNCTELECGNVLQFLRKFERNSYEKAIVQDESEIMSYNHLPTDVNQAKLKNNSFYLSKSDDNYLEKYTFSNALITSVKLGIWESALDKYIDSMEYVTEDLKHGRRIKMTRAEVLRKTGELFALRHLINLSSDLLDTPDFYWDREQLENLYIQTCAYFSIQRRTKVNNYIFFIYFIHMVNKHLFNM